MSAETLPVVHVVSAMPGAYEALWGKERVIASLMRAQHRSGAVHPRLVTFEPCGLASILAREGFRTETLADRHRTVSLRAFAALRRCLSGDVPAVVHTHGYKANVVARMMRASGAPMRGLVATCHGWIDETPQTRIYNHIDRATSAVSDVVTVTDRAMLQRFPAHIRRVYVANGIEDREPPTSVQRFDARAYFGLPRDRVLAGSLGRIESAKGIREMLQAAQRTRCLGVHWVFAGSGPMENEIRTCDLPNVTFLGYVRESDRYLDALDLYVQASYTEGLSLALLEAMRAQLPIVATFVGSTADALRDHREALLVRTRDVDAIIRAVRKFLDDPLFADYLAVQARSRFEQAFRIENQHEAFLEIYRSCDRRRTHA